MWGWCLSKYHLGNMQISNAHTHTHTHTHTQSEILNNIERETHHQKAIIKNNNNKKKEKNNTSYILPLKCHLKWSQNISSF